MKNNALILLLLIPLAAETPTASPKEAIAVHKLQAIGITEDEADVLTSKLRGELMNTANFKVLERGQMDEILKEQQFQASGACTESQCLIEMGQLLGVSDIVAGSIGKVGGTYSVNVRIFSVKTGEIKKEVSRTYEGSVDGLLKTEMTAVANLLAGKEAEPSKKSRTWMWVAGGAAVVGAGAAVYFLTSKDESTQKTSEKTSVDLNLEW